MRSKKMGGGGKIGREGGSLIHFTKPGAWLPPRSARPGCSAGYNGGRESFSATSPRNRFSGSCLPSRCRGGNPQTLYLPLKESPRQTPGGFKKFAAICPNRARRFLPGTGRCPRAPAGQAQPLPAPPRPGPRARPAGARPRRRGRGRSRCRPPRLPRTLHRARHPPAQRPAEENKMIAAYDFQFQRLANGVQTSASSE